MHILMVSLERAFVVESPMADLATKWLLSLRKKIEIG